VHEVGLERPEGLEGLAFEALVRELVHRLEDVESRADVRLLIELEERLEPALCVRANRYSHVHLHELLGTYFFWHAAVSGDVEGETFLELGAGSENPLALPVAMHVLGGARSFGLEPAPLLSGRRQAKAIARILYWLTLRRDLFTRFDLEPFASRIAERARQYDYARLSRGDLALPEAVSLIASSAEDTGLPSESVDRVASSSFLEHPSDPERVVAEIARITRPGGLSIHNIDAVDHGVYGGAADSPVSFLLEAEGEEMVRHCNRMRIFEFVQLFERHGFELLKRADYDTYSWTDEQLAARVRPFREMSVEQLTPLRSVLVLRRHASPR